MNRRVAIVTGAGRGIGRDIARQLAADGVDLVLVSRTASELEETARIVRASGARALDVLADVTDRDAVASMAHAAFETFGRIDVLVNNAGIVGTIGPLADNDVDHWIATIHTNLVGVFLCCRAVIPMMTAAGGGVIVNMSGGGATFPFPRFSAYAASKAGVVRLTETLAQELAPANIRVNAVAPGAVDTRLFRETGLDVATVPSALAAGLVSFLASDRSRGLTGRLIAAPHDGWQHWQSDDIAEAMDGPWLTLRRIDRHTLAPLVGQVVNG